MIRTFVTPTGILVPAVTTRQMSEVDRIAMEETGPNLFQMMENAGRNLALTAMEEMGAGWREACYLVLAGSGGNGGGGNGGCDLTPEDYQLFQDLKAEAEAGGGDHREVIRAAIQLMKKARGK